ncbi:MAG: hypothetical protein J5616_00890 [Bacteroidaceae bacterium]|nr:hypothetical protein [Bacteroidaceae bacterium]
MSVHYVYTKDGAKYMRPILTRQEYLKLRNGGSQLSNVSRIRQGEERLKSDLVQMNYSCLPNEDGTLKGSKHMSTTVGMDIDWTPSPLPHEGEEQMATRKEEWMRKVPELVQSKKKELGLMMLERSATKGYHLVFRRRPELTQEENLKWASDLLGVKFDKGAKDITRVFFTTTASEEDLLYLDDEIFEIKEQGAGSEGQEDTLLVRNSMANISLVPCSSLLAPEKNALAAFDLCAQQAGLNPDAMDVWGEHSWHTNLMAVLSVGVGKLMTRQQLYAVVAQRLPNYSQTEDCKKLIDYFYEKYDADKGFMNASLRQINAQVQKKASSPDASSPSQWRAGERLQLEAQLEDWGRQIEALFPKFPILKDVCKGLKRNQYPAAVFVAGGLMMTLMTRCTYRFYHRPEELRRLNNSTFIIGDPASGKSFATRLYKLLTGPIVVADMEGRKAINAYREEMRTKGANKEKPKKPKVVVRIHPARTSNAQFIQDMVNAVEVVDGEEMHLHMLTFDTELDNTVSVQKGGSWIDKQSLELKAFHNEEDGQAYSNNDSIFQDFYVFWNFIYTGTPIALKKKVNEQNFGSGLATRLTCIPLPTTNFKMMDRESHVDIESDERLKECATRLDRMKGELPVQKIVDALYDWTARRMEDAEENHSRADEMLLKRCAYHGLNFSAPFIVLRHWESMHEDGQYCCGTFETDKVDWQLAELLVNIQFACQRHFFGHLAEKYFDNQDHEASVNVKRKQKSFDAFERLPEEFTTEDVMRCFNLTGDSAARVRIKRLTEDHLVKKVGTFKENGKLKGKYRKTGVLML